MVPILESDPLNGGMMFSLNFTNIYGVIILTFDRHCTIGIIINMLIRGWILRCLHCILCLVLLQRHYRLGLSLPLLISLNAPAMEGDLVFIIKSAPIPTKHCQRYNGPIGCHHNWNYLYN